MRASVELHEDSKEGLPPVKAKVTLGKEDLSIKVTHTHTHTPDTEFTLYSLRSHAKSRFLVMSVRVIDRCVGQPVGG